MVGLITLFLCLVVTRISCQSFLQEKRSASGLIVPTIEKVNDNLYVASGFALGNIIMVIAPEGLIIVDTTESLAPAKKIKDEFRKITDAPIKAIIYTHHHLDHIGGAKVFIEDPKNPPDVWAHHLLEQENEAYFTYAFRARYIRSMRHFGVFLNGSKNSLENDGYETVLPNKLVYEPQINVTIAGLPVTFVALEGETVDQLGVWIPSMKAFLVGDTFYISFPNTYTIRGAPVRNPVAWYKSVDRILGFEPEAVIPSHGPPFLGHQSIEEVMIPYRDGIQYMHDQAVRYINQGLKPDEVAKRVQFPNSLKQVEALQEEYGMVEWSVKGVFQLYLGWFSGAAEDILPLTYSEKAQLIADMVGGSKKLSARAKHEVKAGNFKNAIELSSLALQVDPTDNQAKVVRVKALNNLANEQINSVAQNYLRTSALETAGKLNLSSASNAVGDTLDSLDIDYLFGLLPMAFCPEKCGDDNSRLQINFLDSNKTFGLFIRNSVLIIQNGDAINNATLSFVTTESLFRNMMKVRDSLVGTENLVEYSGDINGIGIFKKCFEDL